MNADILTYIMRDDLIKQPVFLRTNQFIIGELSPSKINDLFTKFQNLQENLDELRDIFDDKQKTKIDWLVNSKKEMSIANIYSISKIKINSQSLLNACFSSFTPFKKHECAIEIYGNSRAVFDHCFFHDSQNVSIQIYDSSFVKFTNCIFTNNPISCVISASTVEFENCNFVNDQNFSLYIKTGSKVTIKNCKFKGSLKSILAIDKSHVSIENSEFKECKMGAATIELQSVLTIEKVEIFKSGNSGLFIDRNSRIEAKNVRISDSGSNAINMNDSNGYFYKCIFHHNINRPTIAVNGNFSNPIFSECEITENGSSFAVVSRNCSRPLFDKCVFKNCESNCFSISDFSMPVIQNCIFIDIKKNIVISYGRSKVTLIGDFLIDKIKIDKNSLFFGINNRDEEKKFTVNEDEKRQYEENQVLNRWRSPVYEDNLTPLSNVSIDKIELIEDQIKTEKISLHCCFCLKSDIEILDVENENLNKQVNENDFYSLICGHCICKKCLDEAHSRCPVCNDLIEIKVKIFRTEKCVICLERNASTLIIPKKNINCGHICMCYKCAVECLRKFGSKCPICRGDIRTLRYMLNE